MEFILAIMLALITSVGVESNDTSWSYCDEIDGVRTCYECIGTTDAICIVVSTTIVPGNQVTPTQ